jgi:hypothetical protein
MAILTADYYINVGTTFIPTTASKATITITNRKPLKESPPSLLLTTDRNSMPLSLLLII